MAKITKAAILAVALLVLVQLNSSFAVPNEDFIAQMPSWPEDLKLTLFSGDLNVRSSGGKKIHYFYVSSRRANTTDPTIIVLPGAIGCSSFFSLVKEIGPVVMTDTSFEFQKNLGDWSEQANLVFLDIPTGTGYSQHDKTPTWNDDQVTTDAATAIVDSLFSKFDFSNNPLYIAGEGYAGVWAPLIATKLLDLKPGIKLSGLILGNALVDPTVVEDNFYSYMYGHQLISPDLWEAYQAACPIDVNSPRCRYAKLQFQRTLEHFNQYDVFGYCWYLPTPILDQEEKELPKTYFAPREGNLKDFPDVKPYGACLPNANLELYFQRKEVRELLHVSSPDIFFTACRNNLNEVGRDYQMSDSGSFPVIPSLHSKGIKFLYYAGDSDPIYNFLQSQAWMEKLNPVITRAWHQWRVDNRVAGYAILSDVGTFATVKGAGRFAAYGRGQWVWALVQRFLNGQEP